MSDKVATTPTVPVVDFLNMEKRLLETFADYWVKHARRTDSVAPFTEKMSIQDWDREYTIWKELIWNAVERMDDGEEASLDHT